jgi:hypothetical protein
VAAHIEGDADPMACGRTLGTPVGQHSAGAPGRDSAAARQPRARYCRRRRRYPPRCFRS